MVIVGQDGDGEKQLKCELVAAWFPINHFFPSMVAYHTMVQHATATHHTAAIYILFYHTNTCSTIRPLKYYCTTLVYIIQ